MGLVKSNVYVISTKTGSFEEIYLSRSDAEKRVSILQQDEELYGMSFSITKKEVH